MRNAVYAVFTLLAVAASATAGGLETRDGWIRWLPAGVPMAGYFTVKNTGADSVDITGAESDAFASVSLHETVRGADGTTRMRPIDLPLTVDAGDSVTFEPGGYHLMLKRPRRELSPGDTARITLNRASRPSITMMFEVRSAVGEREGQGQ